jgi:alpha-L-arabinofuranosidase
MDKSEPLVGDQSPRIELDSSSPHGIRQSGLSLVSGKDYMDRVYLRGTPGSTVQVSLIWGEGDTSRQTITFANLAREYRKFPLKFRTNVGTADGALEIAGRTPSATRTSGRPCLTMRGMPCKPTMSAWMNS